MRVERFHMERDVLNVGDEVDIVEGVLPMAYYYTIVPSLAMSGNYTTLQRIQSRHGKVVNKEEHNSTFYIYVEFEK